MPREQTQREQVVEEIALLLLTLEQSRNKSTLVYDTYESAAGAAVDMAYRAHRARSGDVSWWQIAGKPYFNRRMARIKTALSNQH